MFTLVLILFFFYTEELKLHCCLISVVIANCLKISFIQTSYICHISWWSNFHFHIHSNLWNVIIIWMYITSF